MAIARNILFLLCSLELFLLQYQSEAMTGCPASCWPSIANPDPDHFECTHAKYKDFPFECIKNTSTVTYVDVSHNALTAVPTLNLPEVTYLDFSHNAINRIENSAFDLCLELQHLNLSFNGLMDLTLVNEWNNLQLDSIDISHNKLRRLQWNVFTRLSSLRSLNVSNNKLRTLTTHGWYGLNTLEILDLSNNHFTIIGKHFLHGMRRSDLQYLSLRGNRISSIENYAFWAAQRSLKELDLGDNNLRNFDSDMFHTSSIHIKFFSTIETIRLDKNKISVIPQGAFSSMENLRYLNLDENHITKFGTQPVFPPNIEMISLQHNKQLKKITNGTFSGLSKLNSVDLSRCQHLHTIEVSAFDGENSRVVSFKADNAALPRLPDKLLNWPQVTTLDLAGNPWYCDCHMKWMQTLPENITKTITCAHPFHLRGESVNTIHDEFAECSYFSENYHQIVIAVSVVVTVASLVTAIVLIVMYRKMLATRRSDVQNLPKDITANSTLTMQWEQSDADNVQLLESTSQSDNELPMFSIG